MIRTVLEEEKRRDDKEWCLEERKRKRNPKEGGGQQEFYLIEVGKIGGPLWSCEKSGGARSVKVMVGCGEFGTLEKGSFEKGRR